MGLLAFKYGFQSLIHFLGSYWQSKVADELEATCQLPMFQYATHPSVLMQATLDTKANIWKSDGEFDGKKKGFWGSGGEMRD